MRLLFVVPHFFDVNGSKRHGSSRDMAPVRLGSLVRCISSIHHTFGQAQEIRSLAVPEASYANANVTADSLTVIVCSISHNHLLKELTPVRDGFQHHVLQCHPRELGFECHALLRDHLDAYDFFCYLEDDLCLYDAWFFKKLELFNEKAGPRALLQPNRFEVTGPWPLRKVYVDGDLPERLLPNGYDIHVRPQVLLSAFGKPVLCRRPRNPHSGCFFLTRDQMAHWAKQPYFLNRDCSFVGPLESAATLGVTRAFRVYKPAPCNSSFLEIQHSGEMLTRRLDARDRAWRAKAQRAERPEYRA